MQHDIRFRLSEEMVQAFARLTGDHNSLHMDEQVARKSRYRRRIVHGMLPLSFLQLLGGAFPGKRVRFETLRVRFQQPVYAGDSILLEIVSEGTDFKASFRKSSSGELVTRASGRIALHETPHAAGALESRVGAGEAQSFLRTDLEEAQFGITELAEKVEGFEFRLCREAVANFAAQVWSAAEGEAPDPQTACPNLLAAVMLSTLVGMRLPGRFATFTSFQIEFEKSLAFDHPYWLQGTVEGVNEGAELLAASVELHDAKDLDAADRGTLASGKFDAMVNAAPRSMPSCAEIRENHVGLGLEDKVVVVTGASRGIGETTVKLFAMLGSKVVVNYYRGEQDAHRIADEIRASGGDATALQCDIRDEQQVKGFFGSVMDTYGTVDILVNNAVKEFSPKPISDSSWNDYLGELEVSVRGLHACCRAAIPIFKRQRRGKIVNLSSVAVDNPVGGQSRYITAKSAVLGYTKSLAVELAKYGVQANVVVPNMTDTDLVATIPTAYREKLAQSRPSKRHVAPIEVAQAVAFVASSWADAITGQKVVLNLGEPPFA